MERKEPASAGQLSGVFEDRDERFMREALSLAQEAVLRDEVPVGCVVVAGEEVVGRGYNLRESLGDPTAHAEILALREAARAVGSWRLEGCTVYVTLEPCCMCAGAMVLARVERLVYGAPDPRGGAAGSLYNVVQDERLNHRLQVTPGVLAEECGEVLRDFFRRKRRED
jgi:tRNA(adenine34) deaminase